MTGKARLLVRVPLAKDPLAPVPPSDEQIRRHTRRWWDAGGFEELFLARPFCARTCAGPDACAAARTLAADEYVQRTLSRTVVSALDEPGALDRLWDDLVGVVRARRPPAIDEHDLLRAFAGHGADWLASRRGAQSVWPYPDTAEFRGRLEAVLLDKLDSGGANAATLLAALRESAARLHARRFNPYNACHLVCNQEPPLCRYRSVTADLVLMSLENGRRMHEPLQAHV